MELGNHAAWRDVYPNVCVGRGLSILLCNSPCNGRDDHGGQRGHLDAHADLYGHGHLYSNHNPIPDQHPDGNRDSARNLNAYPDRNRGSDGNANANGNRRGVGNADWDWHATHHDFYPNGHGPTASKLLVLAAPSAVEMYSAQ